LSRSDSSRFFYPDATTATETLTFSFTHHTHQRLAVSYFTAPNVRPRTRNRWITQVNATIGAIIVTAAAQIAPI
jgi:hypothetical protein